jgi:uncharacterized membrane protein
MEQQLTLFIGSALVMVGLFVTALSIKFRNNGSTGIVLLGPIPIVWRGKNRLLFILPIVLFIFMTLLVFLL